MKNTTRKITLRERFEQLSADFSSLQIQRDFAEKQYAHSSALLETAQYTIVRLQTALSKADDLYEVACSRADEHIRALDRIAVQAAETNPRSIGGLFLFKLVDEITGAANFFAVQAYSYDAAVDLLSGIPGDIEYCPDAVKNQFNRVALLSTVAD